jgi:perosamine synthetase
MQRFVPVYSPRFAPDDAVAVARAVADGQVAQSPIIAEFERVWAQRCAMPFGVAVANGTAALELSVSALGLCPGDEILCPAFTIISCVRAIVLSGAVPVLVDADPATWCIDLADAETKLSPRTRAVLPVHAFGVPYDHEAVAGLARDRGLLVIEDAAQAHGARAFTAEGLRPTGGLGDVSVTSFYANKPVTSGEGGMVLARSEKVAERVRDLANLFLRGPRRFFHEELGHNYRMSSLQAALGLSQALRLDETLATKRRIAAWYRARLEVLPELELQRWKPRDEPIHWMNGLVLSDRVSADAAALGDALRRRGIDTRPFFWGLHEQPALRARGLFAGERHPVTERLARRGLYLPSGLDLDEETVEHVVSELRAALAEVGAARIAVPEDTARPGSLPDAAVFGPLFAEAYDALYESKDYAGEVTLLERAFERHADGPVRSVLDLGCGTGRHAAELARRGYRVVGVDRSASMLELARRRLPDVRFVEGDVAEARIGETFDAVVVLFAALSYQTTPEGILRALRTARAHLRPGGVLVADVWLGAAPTGADTRTVRRARRGAVEWTRTGWLRRDPVAQRVDIAYELVRRDEGGHETAAREVHSMHYFSPFELAFGLEAAGFSLVSLGREGDLDAPLSSADLTGLFVARAKA